MALVKIVSHVPYFPLAVIFFFSFFFPQLNEKDGVVVVLIYMDLD